LTGLDDQDSSGRKHLLPNVAASWLAHGVAVVIGFVMPRLLYESVGHVALGLWDLGWSLVTYVAYSGLGLGSAVTYYVARQRAEGNVLEVQETIATAWWCQVVLACLAGGVFTLLFVTFSLWMPGLAAVPGAEVTQIGMLLGLTVLVGVAGGTAQGLLTGCHRSDFNEYVTLASDITLAVAMTGVLLSGGGLVALAAVTFVTRSFYEATRVLIACGTCAEWSFRFSDTRTVRARELLVFGAKTSTGILQDTLIHQFTRLALAAAAGPVALACYSRYATIARQMGRYVERMAFVIPPITSGMVGRGEERRVAQFTLRTTNAAVIILLPMVSIFGTFGDDLVALWMGPDFVVPGLSWVLALAVLLQTERGVVTFSLSGLNAHGRIALICFAASILGFLVLLPLLSPLDPRRAGLLVALTIGAGIFVPHFVLSCRRLAISRVNFLLKVYFKPLLCNALFICVLLAARMLMKQGELLLALLVIVAGGLVLATSYWLFALDDRMRARVRKSVLRATA
jgi:O-antigen/teichoic acid export membrane protein